MTSAPIAVDALGGDHAPDAIVAGARLAAADGIPIALVGALGRLESLLTEADRAHITLVDAPDVIRMDEPPLAALRKKPRASIKVACDLVRDGAARAVVSAGHTGATSLAAHGSIGLLPGVDRAALAVLVPTQTGTALLIDAGANVTCRPEHLVQFGVMGSAYARVVLGRDSPAVGLLSIGEEAGKGTDLVREAHARLERAPIRFTGNVEARDVFAGHTDVIVCDGFTGNVVLKVGEGLGELFGDLLRRELAAGVSSRVGAWLSRAAYGRFRRRIDDAERGGAPLVGLAAPVVVAHGRSSARAIRNAIGSAAALVAADVVARTREALAEPAR